VPVVQDQRSRTLGVWQWTGVRTRLGVAPRELGVTARAGSRAARVHPPVRAAPDRRAAPVAPGA